MPEKTKYQQAMERMKSMEFSEEQLDFIFKDQTEGSMTNLEWNERYSWLLIATKREIKDWMESNNSGREH